MEKAKSSRSQESKETAVTRRGRKRERSEESEEKEEDAWKRESSEESEETEESAWKRKRPEGRFCEICLDHSTSCLFVGSITKMRLIDFVLDTDVVLRKGSRQCVYICRSHYYEEYEKKTEKMFGTSRTVNQMNRMVVAGLITIPEGVPKSAAKVALTAPSEDVPTTSTSDDVTRSTSDSEESRLLESLMYQTTKNGVVSRKKEEPPKSRGRYCEICDTRTDNCYYLRCRIKLGLLDWIFGTNLKTMIGVRQGVFVCRPDYHEKFEKKTEEMYGTKRSVDAMKRMVEKGELTIPKNLPNAAKTRPVRVGSKEVNKVKPTRPPIKHPTVHRGASYVRPPPILIPPRSPLPEVEEEELRKDGKETRGNENPMMSNLLFDERRVKVEEEEPNEGGYGSRRVNDCEGNGRRQEGEQQSIDNVDQKFDEYGMIDVEHLMKQS